MGAYRGYLDFGHFLTAIIVVSAFSLPLILAHTGLIAPAACWMSMAGGGLVYGTILTFSGVFVSPYPHLAYDSAASPSVRKGLGKPG